MSAEDLVRRLEESGFDPGDLAAALKSMGEAIERTEKTVSDFLALLEPVTVHACPDVGSGLTACCCLPVFELPYGHRIALTDSAEVNCKGVNREREDAGE